jgi:hypothetical protein
MRADDFPSVRDRLWLLAHDEDNGLRPLIDVRALDIGLVGATLADLLLGEHIQIRQGCLYPHARHREAVLDPIATGILSGITVGPGLRLTDVFRSARAETSAQVLNPFQRVYERTVAALVSCGALLAERRVLRSTRYRPADPHLLSSVRAQFTRRLAFPHDPPDPAVDSLCALAWVLNLHSALLTPFSTSEADTILAGIVAQILARARRDSPLTVLPDLAQGVRLAVGDLATAPF